MSERARRLGISALIFGLVNEPPRQALEATWPFLSDEQMDHYRAMTKEDIHLVNACLEAEAERRARQWAALELLDHAHHAPRLDRLPPSSLGACGAGGATGGPATVVVPAADLARSARAVLGWDLPAPEPDAR